MNLPVKIFFNRKCLNELQKKYLIRSYTVFISFGILFFQSIKSQNNFILNSLNDFIKNNRIPKSINCFSIVFFEKSIRLDTQEIDYLMKLYKNRFKDVKLTKTQVVNFFVNLGIAYLIENEKRKV